MALSTATDILLITPPFTQLNTPYPATAYLKGFLNTKSIPSEQRDLGIEVILELFKKDNLVALFAIPPVTELSANAQRIYTLQQKYIQCIEPVISFLQQKNPTLAYAIVQEGFLPQASRFHELPDLASAFGHMGIHDKATYLATLYLEDLSDYIQEAVDPHFGFSRYAEHLARSAYQFDEIHQSLSQKTTFIEELMLKKLADYIADLQPKVIGFSLPFPGNLHAALRCGQYIKNNHLEIPVLFGGGFVNTELRSLNEPRLFQYVDYLTLDDGEAPLEILLARILHHKNIPWKRTYTFSNQEVHYENDSIQKDYPLSQSGTPDYSGLPLDQYLAIVEILNPMNRLWSDGRWNKLTMAHGCYWGKCTFCDVTLDYIQRYEPVQATYIVDRMVDLIRTTGSNGFHFVDEAAPPSLMKEVALEILRRKLIVCWWTNIRFEKSFSSDLCFLLKRSGCIGVSGGLEVASDRLLDLIEKGIRIHQVSRVLKHFHSNGILVHAYLMYGYPSQTVQETIDSMEVVRQFFSEGILQSAFWHRFALTVHSPIAKNPQKYGITIDPNAHGVFANNDLLFTDVTGIDHEQFGFGLKKSLFNYMNGIGLKQGVHSWFDFQVPKTTLSPTLISTYLQEDALPTFSSNAKVYWLEELPSLLMEEKQKKGQRWKVSVFTFQNNIETFSWQASEEEGLWWYEILKKISVYESSVMTYAELKNHFHASLPDHDFDMFWFNKVWKHLQGKGLVLV